MLSGKPLLLSEMIVDLIIAQEQDENAPPLRRQPLLHAREPSADGAADQQAAEAPATPQSAGGRTPRSTFKQRVAAKMAELEATLRRDGTGGLDNAAVIAGLLPTMADCSIETLSRLYQIRSQNLLTSCAHSAHRSAGRARAANNTNLRRRPGQ